MFGGYLAALATTLRTMRYTFLLITALLLTQTAATAQPKAIGPYLNGAFPEAVTDSTPAPVLISQVGAFVDLERLEPVDGLMPYALNVPFWSDGAIKTRWIAIPNDGTHDTPEEQVVFSPEDQWIFPEGTVTVKHFEMDLDETDPSQRRRLETRFIVKGPDDAFYHLTYKWNEDGTDATLLEGSETETLAIRTSSGVRFQSWLYPSRDNCLTCHRDISGSFLGPSTRQLNGEILYPKTGEVANQLVTWNELGIFSEPVDEDSLTAYLTSQAMDDEAATLEERALSYLDSNCAYCHRPGSIRTSTFDARLTTPLDRSFIINGSVFNNTGIQNARIVAPGDTARSLIYQRMLVLGNQNAMPPIAKALIDTAGVELIKAWILSLGSPVSVEDERPGYSELAISVYPSPFREEATVAFTLDQVGWVKVEVFDARGRKVRRLFEGVRPAGRHELALSGGGLAGGTYYVRVTTGEHGVTESAVRLR